MVETPRRALVVEGGGMRGAYAAGALIELFQNSGRTFDAVWATSSGAASSAYAVADQPEGLGIWRDHLHGRRLIHPWRALLGREALDLDYLVDEVFRRRIPLDVAGLHASGTPLRVPGTDVADGSVRYFDMTRQDPFPILRAAMSLPGAVLTPTTIGNAQYIDGGVVDQIPVERAIDAGATDITLVLTRPAGYVVRPVGRLGTWLATRRFPGIRAALTTRHERYARAVAVARTPPPGVLIRAIRPQRELGVKRWTRSRRRLLEAIRRGSDDARTPPTDA